MIAEDTKTYRMPFQGIPSGHHKRRNTSKSLIGLDNKDQNVLATDRTIADKFTIRLSTEEQNSER